ncbi:MAG: rhodanese-like domain-containing protein [Pseudomonadota bacterium]
MRLPSIDPADIPANAPVIIDARKAPARAASGRGVPSARIVDPLRFGHDEAEALIAEIGRETPVTVFCVHGHEVSQYLCALLLVHGADARYVRGGFEAMERGAPAALGIGELRR